MYIELHAHVLGLYITVYIFVYHSTILEKDGTMEYTLNWEMTEMYINKHTTFSVDYPKWKDYQNLCWKKSVDIVFLISTFRMIHVFV